MSTPLFPFVWQYNNQPIEILAQEIVNIVSGSGSGPVNTANYIPVSNGLTFQDSILINNTTTLRTNWIDSALLPWGFDLDYAADKAIFGNSWVKLDIGPASSGSMGIIAVPDSIPNQSSILLLQGDQSKMFTLFGGAFGYEAGFNLDYNGGLYEFGAYNIVGPKPKVIVDTTLNSAVLDVDGNGLNNFKVGVDMDAVVIDADQSITSAGLAGSYITIKVNGVLYKLALYNM